MAVPAAILFFDHQWIFPGPNRDPWIYLGYFKAAPEWIRAFPGAYFGNRLSVILPGFLFNAVLPSLPANILLHLALTWLALISFYGVSRALFGRSTALLSTVCLGTQPYFLFAVGENYVDGFGIAYFLTALLAATQAARRPGRLGPAAAGALSTAIVSANIFYVIYLPVVALHFILLNRRETRRPLLPSFGAATAGAAGVFAAFCVVSKALGGRLMYLIPSTTFASTFLKSASPFWLPPTMWLPRAAWLIFSGLVLLGAIATLVAMQGRLPQPQARNVLYTQILYLGFLTLCLAWMAWRTPGAFFQYWYYASLTIPVAALAFAGQMSLALERNPESEMRFVWGTASFLVLAYTLRTPAVVLSLQGPVALVPLLLGLPAVAVVLGRATGLAARIIFVSSLAASTVTARDLFPHRGGFEDYGGDRAPIFAQVDHALGAYLRIERSGSLFFWFDQNEKQGVLFDIVAATSLSGWRIVTMGFPRFVPGGLTSNGTPVAPGMKIVVLSARETAWPEAEQAIRSLNLRARRLHEDLIEGAAGPFRMIFLEVLAPSAPLAPASP